MVAVDIALVIIVVAAIVGGVTAVSAQRIQRKALPQSSVTQQAVRLLDRIMMSHDGGYSAVDANLLKEAKEIVDEYYKR